MYEFEGNKNLYEDLKEIRNKELLNSKIMTRQNSPSKINNNYQYKFSQSMRKT